MVAALPIFKLASLVIKQSAKPVANAIKRGAKESDMVKKYLLYYPGQAYHRLEFHIRMKLMGHTGKIKVEPLKENAAVELGAEMLGELIVFGIGVGLLYMEYRRQKHAEERKDNKEHNSFLRLQEKVDEMDKLFVEQTNKISELSNSLKILQEKNGK